MNEKEWTAVVLAFTDLFDKLKVIAPEKVNIDKTYMAGKILQKELELIRKTNQRMEDLWRLNSYANFTSPEKRWLWPRDFIRTTGAEDWRKQNEELEKKKEAQHAQEIGDLEQALRLSIEKINKEQDKDVG